MKKSGRCTIAFAIRVSLKGKIAGDSQPPIMKVLLKCTKCFASLPLAVYNAEEPVPCPACASKTSATVFPAFLDRLETASAEAVSDDTEGSCFYHPAKRATVACESCGRFICALCEVELSGARLCPQCLDSGKRKGKLTNLEKSRTLYDNIALGLTILPMLFIATAYFTIFCAPAALYICLRYRKAPRSLVRPGRWKWWLALILSTLQIVGWALIIIFAVSSSQTRHSERSERSVPKTSVHKRGAN